jgi:hypothetical protein
MMIQTIGPSLFHSVRGPIRFESSSGGVHPTDSFAPSSPGFDVDSIYLTPATSSAARPSSSLAPLTAATLSGLGSVFFACSHFSV